MSEQLLIFGFVLKIPLLFAHVLAWMPVPSLGSISGGHERPRFQQVRESIPSTLRWTPIRSQRGNTGCEASASPAALGEMLRLQLSVSMGCQDTRNDDGLGVEGGRRIRVPRDSRRKAFASGRHRRRGCEERCEQLVLRPTACQESARSTAARYCTCCRTACPFVAVP